MENIVYIAIDGKIDGDGSKKNPVNTIEQGLEISRKNHGAGKLMLKSGNYFCPMPIKLEECDFGLTILGETGVTLTGAKPLGVLNWEKHSNGIVKAPVKIHSFDRMFANGEEQVLCRFPNRQIGAIPLDGVATPEQIKLRAEKYKNPVGGYVRGIHVAEWGGNSYKIVGKDKSSSCGLALSWVGDNNRGSAYGKALVAENVFEELDEQNEWFYDTNEETLYWYPPANIDPMNAEISVSVNTEILTIYGNDMGHPAENITIEGIDFVATGRTLFSSEHINKPFVPLLRGDWCVVRSGAVFLENAKNCKISKCNFLSLGGNGLFLSGYQKDHVIDGNTFAEIGASAIQLAGEPSAVCQPSFWQHDLYPNLSVHQTCVNEPKKIGPQGDNYPRDVIIRENHIFRVGLLEKQATGINLSITSRIKILNNTIHDSSRSLINVNDGTFGGHEIANNDLFDAQRETADHGPFNSWGRDRFWSVPKYNASGKWGEQLRKYKVGKGVFDITKIDAYQKTRIHNNRFYHNPLGAHSCGIDLDDGSTNYEIDHNLILGIGIKLREGFDRKVHHNLLVDGQLNIHVPYAGACDEIYENLIYHCQPVALAGCSRGRFKKSKIQMVGNLAYAGGAKIKTPSFIPKFLIEKQSLDQESGLKVPTGWEDFLTQAYGQTGCIAKSPEFKATFGMAEANKGEFWLMGARCCHVSQAIRSSTALSDNDGAYVKAVLPLSKASLMGLQAGDVVRQWNNQIVQGKPFGKPIQVMVWRENAELILVNKA